MDRVKPGASPRVGTSERLALASILLATLMVLAYKVLAEGWFASREPLDLPAAPVLLFFNRSKGCECELAVYRAAEAQIEAWSTEARLGTEIIRIDLDRRRDLGRQFNIIRAPALMLLDRAGTIIFSQKESLSDTAPLDLEAFDSAIKEITTNEW